MDEYTIPGMSDESPKLKDSSWYQEYEDLDLCGGELTAILDDDEDMLEINYPDGSMIDVGYIAKNKMYYITAVKDDSGEAWNEPREIIEVSEKSMLAYELQSIIYRNYRTSRYETPISAHRHSMNHKKMLRNMQKCGCFYCLKIFSSQMITRWIDNGNTALCPFCGIDSVIGESSGVPITKEFLRKMSEEWF